MRKTPCEILPCRTCLGSCQYWRPRSICEVEDSPGFADHDEFEDHDESADSAGSTEKGDYIEPDLRRVGWCLLLVLPSALWDICND